LPDSVVWLTRNHRFGADSGIGRLAADINAGRSAEALQGLREDGYPDVQWLDERRRSLHEALLAGHADYLDTVARDPGDVAAALRAFAGFSVLGALRDGPRGVLQANETIAAHARRRLGDRATAGGPWFTGRPVMVLRNDPLLQLFNGDLGLALPDAQGRLQVFFAQDGGVRAVAPARLPAHETAFALTIHKSQGSEFARVLVLLPQQAHRVLTRELLYTAVTRAREGVTLAGGAAALSAAIGTPTRRRSGLLARLAEAGSERP
jgi:exodeoxyribonuclease V alpha subunit